VISAAAFVAMTMACSSSSEAPLAPAAPSAGTSLPADGSTLKASAPTVQSPINDQRMADTTPPTLRAGASTLTYAGGAVPLQYRFQVFNSTGAMVVDSGLVGASAWTVSRDLEFNSRHTWRVRAEAAGNAGPWSATASFYTAEGGFIRGSSVFDPLTNGRTVGNQVGGHFVLGQGWQADTQIDGIDYDIATCSSCRMEFDVTNFGKGGGVPVDLKWVSMGDASNFGGFLNFRDGPWKMHLEQRSDFDGTGIQIIWRNGAAGDTEPGDHRTKLLTTSIIWNDAQVYHFVLDWNPSGFAIAINGDTWITDGFGGNAYAPPQHRITLGCYPRGETMTGAIWRNFKVTPR